MLRAVTRVVAQSLESVKQYLSTLSIGSVLAVMTVVDGGAVFWLGSKQSEVFVATRDEDTTGVKKGELIIKIVWFDNMNDNSFKYTRMNDLVHVSISSVLVTKSKITWQRTTTNRYYLGEHTHNTSMDLVERMSLV